MNIQEEKKFISLPIQYEEHFTLRLKMNFWK